MEYIFQSTRPMRGATQGNARHHQWPVYFNPRAPCGARRAVQEQYAPNQHFNPRAPCGARPGEFINNGPLQGAFQSTRPMRGATLKASALVSYHSFQSTRPMRGATRTSDAGCRGYKNFNPRAPCGARRHRSARHTWNMDFNPRAPCGARQQKYTKLLYTLLRQKAILGQFHAKRCLSKRFVACRSAKTSLFAVRTAAEISASFCFAL